MSETTTLECRTGQLSAADMDRVSEQLEAGAVVLVPTDTVYGLAVHPSRPDAADRLFAMKRRPRARNLPVMVSSLMDLDGLGVIVTEQARTLFDALAPGPLSVALGLEQDKIPTWLEGRVEIAVRIPDHDMMRALLQATGPLLVTSANIHGESTPETCQQVLERLDGTPDIIIDGGPRHEVPSTLVNCNLPKPDIERIGVIPPSRIMEILG